MPASHHPISKLQRGNAKRMRRIMTDAELKLWNEVRAHRLMGLGFRRQYPIKELIVDFACPQFRLLVELDGTQHADDRNAIQDKLRSARLEADGWTVLRFWNDDVLGDIDGVCQHIVNWVEQRG